MCFSKEDVKLYDDLMQPLQIGNIDKSLWNDKCDYLDLDTCTILNKENFNLIVLQLNVRSLLLHQREVKLLRTLETKGSKVDALLLCETFFTDKTSKLLNFSDYELITNNCHQSKGGGMAIML